MIGVAGFGAGGDDGDAAFRSGDAFGFAEVFAEKRIDGVADAFGLVGLEEAKLRPWMRLPNFWWVYS